MHLAEVCCVRCQEAFVNMSGDVGRLIRDSVHTLFRLRLEEGPTDRSRSELADHVIETGFFDRSSTASRIAYSASPGQWVSRPLRVVIGGLAELDGLWFLGSCGGGVATGQTGSAGLILGLSRPDELE